MPVGQAFRSVSEAGAACKAIDSDLLKARERGNLSYRGWGGGGGGGGSDFDFCVRSTGPPTLPSGTNQTAMDFKKSEDEDKTLQGCDAVMPVTDRVGPRPSKSASSKRS